MGSSSSKKGDVEETAAVKGAEKDANYGSIDEKPELDRTDGSSAESKQEPKSKPEQVSEVSTKETEDTKAKADDTEAKKTNKSASKEKLVETKRE